MQNPPSTADRSPRGFRTRLSRLLLRRSFQVALLCLAAFATSAAVSRNVFEAMPHLEDEHADYFQAAVFAGGRIAAPAPPSKDSFFIPFVINRNGLWFAKYTPGYPLILALGFLVGAPWLINALASALAVLGVFLLGRDLFGEDAGLLAACLGAVSPSFVILSGSFLPHPVTMALLVFFAWAFLRARRPAQSRASLYSSLAGVLLGLAVLARPWTALAIALPFLGLALFDLGRALLPLHCMPQISALKTTGQTNIPIPKVVAVVDGRSSMVGRLRPYVMAYLPMAGFCLLACALLPLYNNGVAGSPFLNTYTLWWPYDTVGFGPGIGQLGEHTLKLALLNAKLDLAAFRTALLGWPAPFGFPLVILPLALGLLLAPRSRYDVLALLPPLFLIAAQLAYWARAGEFYGGRYYSEGMPFLWLLVARGILKFSGNSISSGGLHTQLEQSSPRHAFSRGARGLLKFSTGRWRMLLVRAALPLFLVWSLAFQILPRFAAGHALYGITRANLAEVSDLHNALVFVRIKTWTDYANFSWLNSPMLDGDVVFARDMGSDRNAHIIRLYPGRAVYYSDPGGALSPYSPP